MASNLEKLQQEMPLVFELRDSLVRTVAEETANYHVKIDRLRATLDGSDFERRIRQEYDEHSAKLALVRAEIEQINAMVADILSFMPPEPIFIRQQIPS